MSFINLNTSSFKIKEFLTIWDNYFELLSNSNLHEFDNYVNIITN